MHAWLSGLWFRVGNKGGTDISEDSKASDPVIYLECTAIEPMFLASAILASTVQCCCKQAKDGYLDRPISVPSI